MKQTIENQLREMLKEYLGEVEFEKCKNITSDTNIKNDLGLDSLDFYAILMEVENHYNFTFSAKDEVCIANKPTLDNISDVVYKKIK